MHRKKTPDQTYEGAPCAFLMLYAAQCGIKDQEISEQKLIWDKFVSDIEEDVIKLQEKRDEMNAYQKVYCEDRRTPEEINELRKIPKKKVTKEN